MRVIATAGHVDHGKSTLVRALTGMEPDRWSEEKRRGLTIDLGFAWTTLNSGTRVSMVDVPGHERFLGNMLAGLGPAPSVLMVVAADEGWREQSSDHRDAIRALGIDSGLIIVTKTDRVSAARVADVIEQARRELAHTGLADAPALAVSAATGEGIEQLRAALDDLLAEAPPLETEAPVRLWIDRSFTIAGAGTVVTGTLGAGTVAVGDQLDLLSVHGQASGQPRPVSIRGLQAQGSATPEVGPVSRAALNIRGVATDEVARGDVLLTPGAFHLTRSIDVRRVSGQSLEDVPRETTVHAGTAAVTAQVRPLGADHARLLLPVALPLLVGDGLVLRGTGARAVLGGVRVLDVDPPALNRRGAGRARAAELEAMGERGDAAGLIRRRGAVRADDLARMGLALPTTGADAGVEAHGPWLASTTYLEKKAEQLRAAVALDAERHPLGEGLPRGAALSALDLPDPSLLVPVIARARLDEDGGHIRDPRHARGLGAAEASVAHLEQRLAARPFAAPEADDLEALGLGAKELAAAARLGRLVRLEGGIVLLPSAPALAMRQLAALPQPFTTSEARQALETTRRVVIPLLEHLDARGWTRRLDAGHREVVR
ncbi:MAG: selenocysteine-specific translation elongation factor [Dermabacter sp.]|nr:selenocysteine-specific translation elongation factor [Dermabacter sp.]